MEVRVSSGSFILFLMDGSEIEHGEFILFLTDGSGSEHREVILLSEGGQYITRVVVLTDMVKRGYEEEIYRGD